jgi:hypothetical protein
VSVQPYEEIRRDAKRARVAAAAVREAAHRRVEDMGTLVNASVGAGVHSGADDFTGERQLSVAERGLDASRTRRVFEAARESRDRYREVQEGAERARAEARASIQVAQRRLAEIDARLIALRAGGVRLGPGPNGDAQGYARSAREAVEAAARARARDRRGHERAARVHERAAEQHDRAAVMYDALGDTPRADREREGGVHEREAAECDRQAGKGDA